jgi:hypothetical protein
MVTPFLWSVRCLQRWAGGSRSIRFAAPATTFALSNAELITPRIQAFQPLGVAVETLYHQAQGSKRGQFSVGF